MIIGISGKLGSGKDLVGNIIHYLIARENKLLSTKSVPFKEWMDYSECSTGWETKKYAYKLKQIVALLLGCTVEQLEDREFKEKELGEEWGLWRHISPMPFATKKEAIQGAFDWDTDVRDVWFEKLTPRKILQLLGTEAGRDIIHPNIWVNALMSDYKKDLILSPLDVDNEVVSRWIITDMRFPNELKAVKDRDGITIRIERPNTLSEETKGQTRSIHPSETALDNAEFDYVIYNGGTIEELVEKVKEVLIKENII